MDIILNVDTDQGIFRAVPQSEAAKAFMAGFFFTEDPNKGYPMFLETKDQFIETFGNLGYVVSVSN